MMTEDLLERLEADIGVCSGCGSGTVGNRSVFGCDRCGSPLPKLSRELFQAIMNDPRWLPEVALEVEGSKLRRTIFGMPFAGFK